MHRCCAWRDGDPGEGSWSTAPAVWRGETRVVRCETKLMSSHIVRPRTPTLAIVFRPARICTGMRLALSRSGPVYRIAIQGKNVPPIPDAIRAKGERIYPPPETEGPPEDQIWIWRPLKPDGNTWRIPTPTSVTGIPMRAPLWIVVETGPACDRIIFVQYVKRVVFSWPCIKPDPSGWGDTGHPVNVGKRPAPVGGPAGAPDALPSEWAVDGPSNGNAPGTVGNHATGWPGEPTVADGNTATDSQSQGTVVEPTGPVDGSGMPTGVGMTDQPGVDIPAPPNGVRTLVYKSQFRTYVHCVTNGQRRLVRVIRRSLQILMRFDCDKGAPEDWGVMQDDIVAE